jgi:hypothetical protein
VLRRQKWEASQFLSGYWQKNETPCKKYLNQKGLGVWLKWYSTCLSSNPSNTKKNPIKLEVFSAPPSIDIDPEGTAKLRVGCVGVHGCSVACGHHVFIPVLNSEKSKVDKYSVPYQ